jgi:hypothetical protein
VFHLAHLQTRGFATSMLLIATFRLRKRVRESAMQWRMCCGEFLGDFKAAGI